MRDHRSNRQPGCPTKCGIYEVGLRDGLVNEPTVVPPRSRPSSSGGFAAAGRRSSRRPPSSRRRVPQLSDAAEVLELLGPDGLGCNRPVLVPNERGLTGALPPGAGGRNLRQRHRDLRAEELNRLVADRRARARVCGRAVPGGRARVRIKVSRCASGTHMEGDVLVAPGRRRRPAVGRPRRRGVSASATRSAWRRPVTSTGCWRRSTGPASRLPLPCTSTTRPARPWRTPRGARRRGPCRRLLRRRALGGCPYAKSATGNLPPRTSSGAARSRVRTGVDLESPVHLPARGWQRLRTPRSHGSSAPWRHR